MDLQLRGKRVLITGASKGIGAATAEVFAEEGAHVALAARDAAALETLCARLSAAHGIEAAAHPTDLRDPAQLAALAEAAGDCDVLVNNAGDIPTGDLHQVDEAAWRHGWELKVFGFVNLTRLVHARMKARGAGVIVNVIGAAGEKPDPNYIAGVAGNASLMAFTRALGGTSLYDGIRVVGVNPGPVQTDRVERMLRRRAEAELGDAERWRELLAALPLGRAAHAREVGDLAAFLASPRSGYTTGVVMTLDGGRCARP